MKAVMTIAARCDIVLETGLTSRDGTAGSGTVLSYMEPAIIKRLGLEGVQWLRNNLKNEPINKLLG